MSQTPLPTFDAVRAALHGTGARAEPAEAHGSLCGLACVLGAEAAPAWLTEVMEDGATGSQGAAVLADVAAASWGALEEGDLSFTLLLPGDSVPLADRADSLAGWCQGFTAGLAMGAERAAARPVLGAGVTAEIIDDFSHIARVAFTPDEQEDEGESAYAELVEYIRVSVQLIFEELRDLRDRRAAGSLH
jgi:uncharacterized protein YgfB (UPF0149 family)